MLDDSDAYVRKLIAYFAELDKLDPLTYPRKPPTPTTCNKQWLAAHKLAHKVCEGELPCRVAMRDSCLARR